MAFSNTWRLDLLRELVMCQLKVKDQATFLGLAWRLLHPLMMLSLLLVFFSHSVGRGIDNYAVYLMVGLVHYTHFSSSTSTSMSVLFSMKRLTCEAIFPKELLVIGSVLGETIAFVISMAICLLLALASGVHLSWPALLLPLVMVIQVTLAMWVSILLACAYVFVRDIGHVYQVVLRILFFVTPVFYGAHLLGKRSAETIVMLNPLAQVMNLSRSIIIDGRAPSMIGLVTVLAINLAAVYVALRVFRRFEPVFAERL